MGVGVDVDYHAALYWAQKGAAQSDVVSLNTLGSLYEKGNGVEQDYAKSYYYYRKAAELGDPYGANNIGIALLMGRGVEKNATEAVIWNTIAAKANIPGAQFNLALQYAYGDGVEVDYQESHHWMELAAANGDSRAIEVLNNEHNSEFKDRLKYDGLYCSEDGHVLRFYDDGIVISITISTDGPAPHYPRGDFFTRRNWNGEISQFDLQGNRIVFYSETNNTTFIYSCVVNDNRIVARIRSISEEIQLDIIYHFYSFSQLPGYIA